MEEIGRVMKYLKKGILVVELTAELAIGETIVVDGSSQVVRSLQKHGEAVSGAAAGDIVGIEAGITAAKNGIVFRKATGPPESITAA